MQIGKNANQNLQNQITQVQNQATQAVNAVNSQYVNGSSHPTGSITITTGSSFGNCGTETTMNTRKRTWGRYLFFKWFIK